MSGFAAYLAERFPPVTYGIMVAVFYLAAAWVARASSGGGPVSLGLRDLVPALVIFLYFFHLRVFDEHKDAEGDLIAHPERVLSRGIVTLGQLSVVAWAGIGLQALASWLLGWPALVAWAVAFAYSLLMRVEFFAPGFLRRHIVLYLLTHNPSVILLAWYGMVAATGWPEPLPSEAWLGFGLVASSSSALFEVGRKVRAPGDERQGQETYSASLGIPGAVALGGAAAALFAATVVWLGLVLGFGPWFYWAVAGLILWNGYGWVSYLVSRTRRSATRVAGITSVTMLAGFLLVAVEIGLARGVVWT